MSKLIIPAAELIGTPLTTEELKGILAGYSINKKCNCSYERSEGVAKDTTLFSGMLQHPLLRKII